MKLSELFWQDESDEACTDDIYIRKKTLTDWAREKIIELSKDKINLCINGNILGTPKPANGHIISWIEENILEEGL